MRRLTTVVCFFALACAEPKSPVEPTPAVAAPPLPTFFIGGSVNDTAGRPLGGATVVVVDGPRAGTLATTDHNGRYAMPGSFSQSTITMMASKDGFVSQQVTLPPRGRSLPADGGTWGMGFSLESLAPSANLSGDYTLTLTADRSCTKLPEAVRTRSYTASIALSYRSTHFLGTLKEAEIVQVPLRSPHFEIDVAGDFANISIRFVERLADASYLAIEGSAAAAVAALGIGAPFNAQLLRCGNLPAWSPGDYWWCGADVEGEECSTGNHQIRMVRR